MRIIRPFNVTDAVLTYSDVPEDDYAAYDGSHTYIDGERCIVIAADVHEVWQSLQNGNSGNVPSVSPVWWVLVGPTNRWKMFDQKNLSYTENPDSIHVTLACTGRVDAIVLRNISAVTVRFVMTDALEGVVYDSTYDLISDSGIVDAYAYCFEPIVKRTNFAEIELPPYSDVTLDIYLSDPGEIVRCGTCVIGQQRFIGDTKWGYSIGFKDYSVTTVDRWGVRTFQEGDYEFPGDFAVQVDTAMVEEIRNLLASYRVTPIPYIGSDMASAAILYGKPASFNVVSENPNFSICRIQIEDLT